MNNDSLQCLSLKIFVDFEELSIESIVLKFNNAFHKFLAKNKNILKRWIRQASFHNNQVQELFCFSLIIADVAIFMLQNIVRVNIRWY